MNRRYNSRFFSDPGMPLFFRLWFGFIFLVGICIFAFLGIVVFNVAWMASNPAELGNYFGEIMRGFQEAMQ